MIDEYIDLNEQQINLLKQNKQQIQKQIQKSKSYLQNAKNDFDKQFLTKQIQCLTSNVCNIQKVIDQKKIKVQSDHN